MPIPKAALDLAEDAPEMQDTVELPRPRPDYYKGGMPLHALGMILKKLGIEPGHTRQILHPFGGMAEHGIRCDLQVQVAPDVVCDAHVLPFPDETFDVTWLDPPYSDQENKDLYKIDYRKLERGVYIAEAVRVTKKGGYVVWWHRNKIGWGAIPDCKADRLIMVAGRPEHAGRHCQVFRKRGGRRLIQQKL